LQEFFSFRPNKEPTIFSKKGTEPLHDKKHKKVKRNHALRDAKRSFATLFPILFIPELPSVPRKQKSKKTWLSLPKKLTFSKNIRFCQVSLDKIKQFILFFFFILCYNAKERKGSNERWSEYSEKQAEAGAFSGRARGSADGQQTDREPLGKGSDLPHRG
jgi:hypothetical protein